MMVYHNNIHTQLRTDGIQQMFADKNNKKLAKNSTDGKLHMTFQNPPPALCSEIDVSDVIMYSINAR